MSIEADAETLKIMIEQHAPEEEMFPALMKLIGTMMVNPIFVLCKQAEDGLELININTPASPKQWVITIFPTKEEAVSFLEKMREKSIQRGEFPKTMGFEPIATSLECLVKLHEHKKEKDAERIIAITNAKGDMVAFNLDSVIRRVTETIRVNYPDLTPQALRTGSPTPILMEEEKSET